MAYTHANRPSAIPHSALTVRVAVLFFLPLIISTELHQLSHSLVHAFLARLGDATITLAAFSIAFAFNTTFSGIISVEVQAAMSYITDKRSFWRIARFYFVIRSGAVVRDRSGRAHAARRLAVRRDDGREPGGDAAGEAGIGRDGPVDFPNQVRNMATALCMMHRRTLPISYATVIRHRFAGAHADGAAVLDGRAPWPARHPWSDA